jgi:gp16 family phage-associated protein
MLQPQKDELDRPHGDKRLLRVEDFRSNGMSVAGWARAHGFSPSLVYQVLAGRKALRGQSFQIARALGMK